MKEIDKGRRVVRREFDGRAARAVVIERVFDTSIADLWDAVVTPERLERWFLPVSGDLVEGGRYQLEHNAGGTIRRCQPPSYLELSWETPGDIGWVTVTLASIGSDETLLTLEHIAEDNDDADARAFWTQYGPGAVGVGWDIAFRVFHDYLVAGAAFVPVDEETWVASDEGLAFVRSVADDWAAASIAYGTEPREAMIAAENAFRFFTGT